MSIKGRQLIADQKRTVLISMGIVVGICALAWLLAWAGIDTLGALGPEYHAAGLLPAFNIHVLTGLTLPIALVTQVVPLFRRRYIQIWFGGGVVNGMLLLISTLSGLLLTPLTDYPALQFGLYSSAFYILVIWACMARYFFAGDWFFYRLWAVRSAMGLVLQVAFRGFMGLIFAFTGNEELASVAGFWLGFLVAFSVVEWMLLPLVWRPRRNFSRQRFKKGTVLIREHEVGQALYILEEGQVEVTQRHPGKGVKRLAVLEAGSWFGEMSLIDDKPANATVRALGPIAVTAIDRDGFHRLFGSLTPLREVITKTMTDRLSADLERGHRNRLDSGQRAMPDRDETDDADGEEVEA